MRAHYHPHGRQISPLEIGELADFDVSLGNLPEEEKRRRRVIYLRDAVAQLEMGKALMKGFGCIMIPFFIVPIFWPFIAFFWYMRKKAAATIDRQTRSALAYWGIHEHEIMVTEAGGSAPPPRPGAPVIEAEFVEEPDPEPPKKRYRREP